MRVTRDAQPWERRYAAFHGSAAEAVHGPFSMYELFKGAMDNGNAIRNVLVKTQANEYFMFDRHGTIVTAMPGKYHIEHSAQMLNTRGKEALSREVLEVGKGFKYELNVMEKAVLIHSPFISAIVLVYADKAQEATQTRSGHDLLMSEFETAFPRNINYVDKSARRSIERVDL
jgi:hypothetical protein